MIESIIAAFNKNFVGFDVNIETVVGDVLGPEGYKVSGKKTGNKIDAQIIYKNGHVIRYALNDLLAFAKSEKIVFANESAPDFPVRGVVEGFYGKPWSHEQRLRAIEHFGD